MIGKKTVMRTFVIVHNIPSPYRLHLFRVLSERLAIREVRLQVEFMSRGHRERPHWNISEELSFDHRYWRDIGPKIGGHERHLNPGLLFALWRHRPDCLMVGGIWASFTGMLVSLLPRAGVRIAWLEGKSHGPGVMTPSVRRTKAILLDRFDYVALPGIDGRRYLRLIFADKRAPATLFLPNIIDESRFGVERVDRECAEIRDSLGVEPGTRFALWPARLIKDKGVAPFIQHLDPEAIKGWTIVILGDGPERNSVLRTIEERRLTRGVKLRPYLRYERMPAVYGAADLFVLPSFRDNNPLSVVEALHSGLPVLLSNQLGNHPEAIREGENGWTIDPTSFESIRGTLHKAFAADQKTLRRMGAVSRLLAQETWSSVRSIDAFIQAIEQGIRPPWT